MQEQESDVSLLLQASKVLFRLEMKIFWASYRMCRKDVGRGFEKLIKKQIT